MTEDNKRDLEKIANDHQVSVASILNKWAIQNDYYVIPRTEKVHRLEENLNYNYELNNDEMSIINNMNQVWEDKALQDELDQELEEGKDTLEQIQKKGILYENFRTDIK